MPSECASAADAEHRLRRAAGLGPVGLAVGPELQRHRRPPPPRARARAGRRRRCRRRRHRDEHPLRGGRGQDLLDAATCASARCRASAASCAACRLAGVSPPIAPSTSSVPIRAASTTGFPSTISATAAVAARVAPHPSVSNVTAAIRASTTASEIRERSPHRPSRPEHDAVEGAVGRGPEPRLVAQVVLEDLSTHAAKRRRAAGCGTKRRLQPAGTASGFDPLK